MGSGLRLGAACALMLGCAVHAESLSLGSMTLFKTKGQPTYAEITINGAAQGDAARLRARVASAEAYRAAGLRYAPALGQITVTPRQGSDGRIGLRLDIPDAAADGSLDLLLLVGDAVSVAMAEYRLDFTGTARVFPALEAGTALIPTGPQAATSTAKGPTIAMLASKAPASTAAPTAAPTAASTAASSATPSRTSTAMSSTAPAASAGATSIAASRVAAAKPTASAPAAGGPVAGRTVAGGAASGGLAAGSTSILAAATAGSAAASGAIITTAMAGNARSSAAPTDSLAAGQAAAALAAWADAWSRRDVDAYIGMYVADFKGRTRPPSHATWVADRRARIESKRSIEVRVSSLSVIPRANLMVLTFTQTYAGDGLRQTSQKRLTMRNETGRWLIQEETELP